MRGKEKSVRVKGHHSGAMPRFAMLTHKLMESAAYRAASPACRALLLELAMMENGRNNGTGLFLSVRDAADRIGVSDPHTAAAAIAEAEALGFIAATAEAHFAVKAGSGSRARYWRLTWQAVGGRMGPTYDYEKREPEPGSRARKRMIAGQKALKRWKREQDENNLPVGNFPTLTPERVRKNRTTAETADAPEAASVRKNDTRFSANGGKPPIVVVRDSHTYTDDQYGADAQPPENQQAEIPPKIPGGPSAALNGVDPQEAIRRKVGAYCENLNGSGRSRLAKQANLSPSDLQQFLAGRLIVSAGKLAALRSAVRSTPAPERQVA